MALPASPLDRAPWRPVAELNAWKGSPAPDPTLAFGSAATLLTWRRAPRYPKKRPPSWPPRWRPRCPWEVPKMAPGQHQGILDGPQRIGAVRSDGCRFGGEGAGQPPGAAEADPAGDGRGGQALTPHRIPAAPGRLRLSKLQLVETKHALARLPHLWRFPASLDMDGEKPACSPPLPGCTLGHAGKVRTTPQSHTCSSQRVKGVKETCFSDSIASVFAALGQQG